MKNDYLAYIGIGANLGDRVQTIIDARQRLANLDHCLAARNSSLYWSSPVGYLDQPAFINCAIELRVTCSVNELFDDMQGIESALGRQRDPSNQNAARRIDLDLLLFGEERSESDHLTVPHPRILERRFVLEPLLELNPKLSLEGQALRERYASDLAAGVFDEQEIFLLGKPIT